MGVFTLREFRTLVLDALRKENWGSLANPTLPGKETLNLYINLAISDIGSRAGREPLSEIFEIVLEVGRNQYPLAPENRLIGIKGVRDITNGRVLTESTFANLRRGSGRWAIESGQLYLWPVPNAISTLEVNAAVVPDRLDDDEASPPLAASLDLAIYQQAVALILEANDSHERAEIWRQRADRSFTTRASVVDYGSGPGVGTTPVDEWGLSHLQR